MSNGAFPIVKIIEVATLRVSAAIVSEDTMVAGVIAILSNDTPVPGCFDL